MVYVYGIWFEYEYEYEYIYEIYEYIVDGILHRQDDEKAETWDLGNEGTRTRTGTGTWGIRLGGTSNPRVVLPVHHAQLIEDALLEEGAQHAEDRRYGGHAHHDLHDAMDAGQLLLRLLAVAMARPMVPPAAVLPAAAAGVPGPRRTAAQWPG